MGHRSHGTSATPQKSQQSSTCQMHRSAQKWLHWHCLWHEQSSSGPSRPSQDQASESFSSAAAHVARRPKGHASFSMESDPCQARAGTTQMEDSVRAYGSTSSVFERNGLAAWWHGGMDQTRRFLWRKSGIENGMALARDPQDHGRSLRERQVEENQGIHLLRGLHGLHRLVH